MTKDISTTIRELAGIDGTVPHTSFTPVSVYDDRLKNDMLISIDGDQIRVGYLAHDFDPQDYFENDDGAGEYHAFVRGDDPNELMKDITDSGKVALFVQCYEHGLQHYSVVNSRTYLDQRWDVGLHGIHTPCDDVQDRYRALLSEKGPEDAESYLLRTANQTLDEYSKVCNGEVYGIVVENWTIEGQHVRAAAPDASWGYIGSDYAVDELVSEFEEPELEGLGF